MILQMPEPKDMRESIEALAHCQMQTNKALFKILEALEALSVWMKHHESLLDKTKF